MEEGQEWVEHGLAGCPASAASPASSDAAGGICHRVALAGTSGPDFGCCTTPSMEPQTGGRLCAWPTCCTVQVSPHCALWSPAPFITQVMVYLRFRIQRAIFALTMDA